MNFWVIFLTGLTIGGLTCMAVQGGLLTSVIAARGGNERGLNFKKNALPVLAFLNAKLLAYIALGALLGWFGQALSLSDNARITLQFLAGLYMVLIALNLLEVHPIFRYAIIQPPRFLYRLVRKESKSADYFAPVMLGLMTVFIPCGTTLAMEALAVSTGSPILGALTMGIFILGTTPLFFGLGFLTSLLSGTFKDRFLKIAGLLVLYLGVTSMNGSLVAADSPLTLQKLADASPVQIDLNGGQSPGMLGAKVVNGIQTYDINITPAGYSPNFLQVKVSQPVRLNLLSHGVYNCALSFRIPALKIAKNLQPTGSDFVEFTPMQKGKLAYSCSMGMYTGVIEVI